MKVLAVDTSSTVAAAALIENEVLLGEYFVNNKKTHSQKLMPMIKELTDSLGLNLAEIDIFSASVGPGSFTGLRIGVTSIKAMAYALNKPVVSISTLDALAYNYPVFNAIICPIMDARNNQVYTALYKFKDQPVCQSEYMALPIADLVQILIRSGENICFVGDGVEKHRDYLLNELGKKCSFAPNNLILNRASSVAQLALIRASEGKLESPVDMVPFYLRKSQAEQEYDRRNGENTNE